MSIHIRQDFVSVSQELCRLYGYSDTFCQFAEDWSHYKHKEDFGIIKNFDWMIRSPLDDLYAEGRQFAGGMIEKLRSFNDFYLCPTLKSYVDSFSFEAESAFSKYDLVKVVKEAEGISKILGCETPWSVKQMISLMHRQIDFIQHIEATLDRLKRSGLYLEESGVFPRLETSLREQILLSLHHSGRAAERRPSTYRGNDEEGIRDLFLVGLNGTVRSYVAGEAINGKGKTDILVNIEGSNEFIGECKFWAGESAYLSTIDQLFGYLTVRDVSVALIMFVKNLNFSDVLDKIEESTPKHRNFVRLVEKREDGWLDYQFKAMDDPRKIINLTVLAYHFPR